MKTATPVLIHAVAITLLYSCCVTQAEIRIGDYHAPGDGLLTIDTNSGLEWLDWSYTAGISYNSMINLFGVGETYDGWRHATSDEARVLLADGFGIPLANWPQVTRIDDGSARVGELVRFFGQDPSLWIIDAAAGQLQSEDENQLLVHVSDNDSAASFIGIGPGPDADYEGSFLGWGEPDIFIRASGHALVRVTSSVPEPTSLSLLCCLGLGHVGLRWHRRNQDSVFQARSRAFVVSRD